MDFMTKAAWVYANEQPDVAKAQRYGINVIYIDPRSGNHVAEIAAFRGAGILVGAYFASSWFGTTGTAFADQASKILNTVLPKGTLPEAPPCMLDLEECPVQWVTDCLVRYRQHQPNRPTSLTDEPFQGGVLPWDEIRNAGLHYYPQLYHGDMSPADGPAVVLEAARYLGDPNRVHPFYAGERWGSDQRDGCYFTLERLPS